MRLLYLSLRLIVAILLSAGLLLPVRAQNQKGYVKTRGVMNRDGLVSPGERISDVVIRIEGQTPAKSDHNGDFLIRLNRSAFRINAVEKPSYVIADPEVLSWQYYQSETPLILVMDQPERQLDARLASARRIRESLNDQLHQKEMELERLKEQQRIDADTYREQLQALYAEQDENEHLITTMADRYSRIDFDQKDAFNRQIGILILSGRLTEADSLLQTKGNIQDRAVSLRQNRQTQRKEQAELNRRQSRLRQLMTTMEREKEDLANDCYSKFEILRMRHDNDSAAWYLQIRAELDSSHVEWWSDAGDFYFETERFPSALQCYRTCLQIIRQADSPDPSSEAIMLSNLALVHSNLNEFDRADSLFKAAMILDKEKGDTYQLAKTYQTWSSSYLERERYKEALCLLDTAKSFFLQSGIPDKELESILLNSFGYVYDHLGDYDKAKALFLQAIAIRENEWGEHHSSLISPLINLTVLAYNKAEYAGGNQAEYLQAGLGYANKALDIALLNYGDRHPKVAICYNEIGFILSKEGNFQEGLSMFDNALQIDSTVYGPVSKQVATSYNNIANVYNDQNDLENAALYLKKSIDVLEQLGPSPKLGLAAYNYSVLCKKKGDFQEAINYCDAALSVLREYLDDEHPIFQMILTRREELQEALQTQ